jgi:hypothetical protein
MLVGGADVSGDKQGEGQRNYVAFLIGTEERINRIYKDIGINGIHMAELSESERQHVHNNLNCKYDDIRVWCLHVQRQHIEQYILNHSRLKNYKKPKVNVHKNFDYHLLRSIKNELENFVFPYRQEFSNIVVQTDGDMGDTVVQWKMQQVSRGKAYELAYAVAWFNQKHVKINSSIEMDLRDSIKESMERDLLG